VVSWSVVYAKQALKDAKKVKAGGLKEKAQALLDVLESDPFQNPPPFEKLVGDLSGAYSRRINAWSMKCFRSSARFVSCGCGRITTSA